MGYGWPPTAPGPTRRPWRRGRKSGGQEDPMKKLAQQIIQRTIESAMATTCLDMWNQKPDIHNLINQAHTVAHCLFTYVRGSLYKCADPQTKSIYCLAAAAIYAAAAAAREYLDISIDPDKPAYYAEQQTAGEHFHQLATGHVLKRRDRHEIIEKAMQEAERRCGVKHPPRPRQKTAQATFLIAYTLNHLSTHPHDIKELIADITSRELHTEIATALSTHTPNTTHTQILQLLHELLPTTATAYKNTPPRGQAIVAAHIHNTLQVIQLNTPQLCTTLGIATTQ
jgi:hypothetical protein